MAVEENNGSGNGTASTEELGKSIELTDVAFRHIRDAKIFAMDIGGSLTKIAYYSTVRCKKIRYDSDGIPTDDNDYEVAEAARLHFIKFETKHIDRCLNHIANCSNNSKGSVEAESIKVTGSGAAKFADLVRDKLGLPIERCDEADCIVQGCNFLLKNISDEAFSYNRKSQPIPYAFQSMDPRRMYPYLLVTVGSGVSILKVEGDDKFERIGGTATGGGTFWGLGRLLTKAKGFDELLALAAEGDHRKVDSLVNDIYSESRIGLAPDLIASSFGKASLRESSNADFSDADVARSLLYMISNDVGQIASLYAMLHGIDTVYFGGFFLRHHPVSMHTVSYSVNYWSKGAVGCRFLRHEGYLGAVGAFLKGAEDFCRESSWLENMFGSSGLKSLSVGDKEEADRRIKDHSSPSQSSQSDDIEMEQLEMDRSENKLRYCPLLLEPMNYKPDTVDLTVDIDARQYWLQCLEDSLPKFAERAIQSQENSPTVKKRAEKFQQTYLDRVRRLKSSPFAHGHLTVRGLLDLREHCLLEYDFHDPYMSQKRMENDAAMRLLPERLSHLSALPWEERQRQLAVGMLAGNVFDWGAKEVALMMESGEGLRFENALGLIGPRPWLMDSLDEWIERLRQGPAHKCACIFIDNSGVDVILGILPFVHDLLERGTDVLLCANNRPVLNDVTHAELMGLLRRAAQHSEAIERGLASGRLQCLDSGQSSPCLDLGKLNQTVAEAMLARGVDLLVLEGMGRAVHTNLYARFSCECLKVAVLKNRWLAEKLGGGLFAVVFQYEPR